MMNNKIEYKIVSGFWKNKYVRCMMVSRKPSNKNEWRQLWQDITTDILNGKITIPAGWEPVRYAYSALHQLMEFRTSEMKKISKPEWLLDETYSIVNNIAA